MRSSPASTSDRARSPVSSMPLDWKPTVARSGRSERACAMKSSREGCSSGSPTPLRTSDSRWGKAGASAAKACGDMLPSAIPPLPSCLTHMSHWRLQRVVTSTKSREGKAVGAMEPV